ncbi:hypothetical protein OJF2_19700 [Aquisphaera giovannonii]|uniref:ABC transmembrane type-1 domain-containing protein n=1 Tax=Aquisphaera giovannonii TaxID=406548 RepID=A0A5B9VYT6_9BACT|nr:hypothetical protein [Aquisphaera giovannonii]QEH33468.1 hypothetical protein OJF2_19700 [Aquisphaera giovannonii]
MVGRLIARIVRRASRLALAIPLLALVLAALLDRVREQPGLSAGDASGSGESVNASIFPLVLAGFDPFVWTSMGHSLGLAAGVAIGSVLLGVLLGEASCRRSPAVRIAVAGFVLAPAVMTPAFLALGLLGVFGEAGPAGLPGLVARGFGHAAGEHAWPWLAWAWAALVPGVGLIAWATGSVRNRLDPSLEDAARVAGAGPFRAWRAVSWPLIRPVVAAAAGALFSATLADPGPPLVLGLRRTIAFQVFLAARARDPFPRAGALGLLLLAAALAGIGACRLWGRRSKVFAPVPAPGRELGRASRLGAARGVLLGLALGTWAVVAWLPVAGLVLLCVEGCAREGFHATLFGGPMVGLLSRTIGLGLCLAALCAIAGPGRHPPVARRRAGDRSRRAAVSRPGAPLLVLGIGLLAVSRIAGLGAIWSEGSIGWRAVGSPLRAVAWLFDPYAVPDLLVLLGGCIDLLIRARTIPEGDRASSRRVEQALAAGATSRRARRLAAAGGLSAGRIALLCTTAATAVSPAIILAVTPDGQTLGPGVISLATRPGPGRSQAASLALLALLSSLIAVAWASRASRRSRVSTHEHLVG